MPQLVPALEAVNVANANRRLSRSGSVSVDNSGWYISFIRSMLAARTITTRRLSAA
jgi:hypothetical protein